MTNIFNTLIATILLLTGIGYEYAYADFKPGKLVPVGKQQELFADSFEKQGNEHGEKPSPKRLKKLAIINSYNEATPWSRSFINTVISEISNHHDFGPVRVAHLNNGRIYDYEDYNVLQQRLFKFYADYKPDYLVIIGTFAFNLRDKIKEHWGDIPILLIAQNDKYAPLDYYYTSYEQVDIGTPPTMKPIKDLQGEYNFTAIISRNKYKETVDMMKEMYPDMKKIVFMGDGTFVNRQLNYHIKEYMKLKYPDMEYEWLMARNEGTMIPYINNPDVNIGLLLSKWGYAQPDLDGQPIFTAGDSFLIKGARRPVFGLRYSFMDYGILGGYFSDVSDFNNMTIKGMQDLLSDKNMRDVPITEIKTQRPYINYQRLEELDIPDSKCPANTVYINRQENKWDKYKDYVYAGFVLSGVIIIGLIVFNLTRKKKYIRRDYDNLVNTMPLGYQQALFTLDDENKIKKIKYSEQNRAMKEINKEHNLSSLLKDNSKNKWQETLDALISDREPKSVIIQIPDTEVYYEFIISPGNLSTETKFFANIFVIDVSDKMKIENVLRDTAKKAIEADNMKTNFLANMSHEIRTPLNAIVGFSHLLCRTNDKKKMEQFIEIIETNNQLLLKIIGDILDLSKADANKLVFNLQSVDVNAVIRTVCRSADMSQKPDVKLITKPEMEECHVTSDPYRLNQVLSNILINAIKFTERGYIEVGYKVERDMLRFYVKDTGFGLSESDKTKLFDRFTKLNSFIQGTGLGLSISKVIVDNLGGSMKVESAGRGRGSTFSFTIPYVLKEESLNHEKEERKSDEERLAELKKKISTKPEISKQDTAVTPQAKSDKTKHDSHLSSYKQIRKKILVVEDNSSNFLLIEAIIDKRYDIVHAWDGEDAVKMFAKETPDLVLMDINLPYKNGYETSQEIRMISKTVPIIAVTAYAQDNDREKVLKAGFNGYVAKPIVENELFEIFKQYL